MACSHGNFCLPQNIPTLQAVAFTQPAQHGSFGQARKQTKVGQGKNCEEIGLHCSVVRLTKPPCYTGWLLQFNPRGFNFLVHQSFEHAHSLSFPLSFHLFVQFIMKLQIFTVVMLLRIFLAVCPQFVKLFVSKQGWHLPLITTYSGFWVFQKLGSWRVGQPTCLFIKTQQQFYKETKFNAQAKPAWLSNRAGSPHISCQYCKHFLGNCGHIG